MTYIRRCFYIILIEPPEKIRNEKVGCSIHLSGTKQKALIRKSQGFFS